MNIIERIVRIFTELFYKDVVSEMRSKQIAWREESYDAVDDSLRKAILTISDVYREIANRPWSRKMILKKREAECIEAMRNIKALHPDSNKLNYYFFPFSLLIESLRKHMPFLAALEFTCIPTPQDAMDSYFPSDVIDSSIQA